MLERKHSSRATSAPDAHETEEILSTSGHESTPPRSGISAHRITHSFLFGPKIDTSFRSLASFCILSNKKTKVRIGVPLRHDGGNLLCCEVFQSENSAAKVDRQDGCDRWRRDTGGWMGTVSPVASPSGTASFLC